jgi:hypothetical protein
MLTGGRQHKFRQNSTSASKEADAFSADVNHIEELTQEISTTSSLKEDTKRLDSQRGAKAPRADANKGRTGRMTAKMILRMSEQAV